MPGPGDPAGAFIPLDVADEPAVIAAIDRVETEAGQLDILVNAAGIEIEKTIEETSLEEWNRSFAVNAICPGYIDTPMSQSFFEGDGSGGSGNSIGQLQKAVRDVHPMRSYDTPEDIANLVNWLASDEARYASGQLWVLDGRLSAQVPQMKL